MPHSTASCVLAQTDFGDLNHRGCVNCKEKLENKCILKSNDGLLTTVCSYQNNGNFLIVNECFAGSFTAFQSPISKKCYNTF